MKGVRWSTITLRSVVIWIRLTRATWCSAHYGMSLMKEHWIIASGPVSLPYKYVGQVLLLVIYAWRAYPEHQVPSMSAPRRWHLEIFNDLRMEFSSEKATSIVVLKPGISSSSPLSPQEAVYAVFQLIMKITILTTVGKFEWWGKTIISTILLN